MINSDQCKALVPIVSKTGEMVALDLESMGLKRRFERPVWGRGLVRKSNRLARNQNDPDMDGHVPPGIKPEKPYFFQQNGTAAPPRMPLQVIRAKCQTGGRVAQDVPERGQRAQRQRRDNPPNRVKDYDKSRQGGVYAGQGQDGAERSISPGKPISCHSGQNCTNTKRLSPEDSRHHFGCVA